MSNINDMGLPQGLPEMLWRHGYWGGFSETAAAQDYADHFEPGNNNLSREMCAADIYEPGGHMYEHMRPREMTAADLGLTKPFVVGREYLIWKHHETGELLGPSVGPEACRARCVRAIWTTDGWSEVDAPYAFWLGAEG
jgi:hypothetical protein